MKRVCIVGYGAIGPVHAEALSSIPDVNLYGICDIDKERADKGATEYNCKAFYSLESCLKDKKIDSIHICTPHFLHYEMIEKSLAVGKMVVTEKPVTMTKEEFNTPTIEWLGEGTTYTLFAVSFAVTIGMFFYLKKRFPVTPFCF